LKQRREKALQMRIDGYTLRAISAEVGIEYANLNEYFKSYKSESIKELQEELFEMQTQRLMELWRNAAADVRKFVPVVDAKGNPIVVPVLDADGQPVFDEAGQPKTEFMRDFGVHINAMNAAARITEKIASHFGLDAPAKTMMLTDSSNPREITFRIVEGKDGRMVEPAGGTAPADIAADIGATSATEGIVGGVEVVSFNFDIPSPLPAPPLKYMD
jgi:AcrR family transcriptional regulator